MSTYLYNYSPSCLWVLACLHYIQIIALIRKRPGQLLYIWFILKLLVMMMSHQPLCSAFRVQRCAVLGKRLTENSLSKPPATLDSPCAVLGPLYSQINSWLILQFKTDFAAAMWLGAIKFRSRVARKLAGREQPVNSTCNFRFLTCCFR